MKILQIGTNIGSQISIGVQALRLIGEQARGMVATQSGDLIWSHDHVEVLPPEIDYRGVKWAVRKAHRYTRILSAIAWADVIHWHFGETFLHNSMDLQWSRWLDKPGVAEFWGSDIRVMDIEARDNPYFERYAPISYRTQQTYERSRKTQEVFSAAGFDCMTSCRSMLPHIDMKLYARVHLVRQRLLVRNYEPRYPDPQNRRPVVVHCPSNPLLKGSEFVLQAVKKLKKRYDFEFVLLHQVSHREALKGISIADIFVDQLLMGSYGIAAIEAMAFGKPTVCYIKASMVSQHVPDLPVVNATVDDIVDVLEDLIRDGQRRYELGQRGRGYVEKYHDAVQVARDLRSVYEGLLAQRARIH